MYYLLNVIKFKNHWKILEKWEKILEKSGNFVSPRKVGTLIIDVLCALFVFNRDSCVTNERVKIRIC